MGKILVIKLSALGDFVIALGAMKAIRAHHPSAHITLLTTLAYKTLAEKSGYFNEVWIDNRPKVYNLPRWFQFKRQLNEANFNRVYDLQNNDRTSIYFNLFSPKPEWVGAVKGASHYYSQPDKNLIPAFTEHQIALEKAGITSLQIDTLDWLNAQEDIETLILPKKYALIIPGCAPSRPEKRWPVSSYIDICSQLSKKDIIPILIGTEDEKDVLLEISNQCPEALNFVGRTSLFDLPYLARNAALAIGNDTGPMHMVAQTGCPALAIFSSHSNPARSAPNGKNVKILQANNWNELPADTVYQEIEEWL